MTSRLVTGSKDARTTMQSKPAAPESSCEARVPGKHAARTAAKRETHIDRHEVVRGWLQRYQNPARKGSVWLQHVLREVSKMAFWPLQTPRQTAGAETQPGRLPRKHSNARAKLRGRFREQKKGNQHFQGASDGRSR